jgi:ubiquitin carboxyl-terminal hydrolase 8
MNKDSTIEEVLEFKKTGTGVSTFINIGNTCYLNSALQTLMHIDELKKIFLKTEKLKLEEPEFFRDKDMRFYDCIKAIYKGYWEDDCLIRPIGLVKYLDQHSYFPMGEQSDSTEVLTCLIQKIHEIICVPKDKSEQFATSDLDLLSIKEWNHHLESKYSQLVNMFWGQYYIKITCEECGTKSKKFETFHYLPITVVDEADDNPSSPTTLENLFANFRTKKYLDEDNKYSCDKCKKKVDRASTESSVWKLPNYLVIQMKRYYERKVGERKTVQKANRMIAYPETFDPHQILSPKNQAVYTRGNIKYNLHSGVFHYGGMMGGHYNCFCWNKDTKEWYQFDDHSKAPIDGPILENNSIYQLVYRLD